MLYFYWVSGSGCLDGLQFVHLQDPAVQELLDPEDKGTVNYKKVKYLRKFWVDI
jgi:hypothetical protein